MMAKKMAPSAAVLSGAEDKRWRCEDAMRTLSRAEEIRKDAALMKDVREHAAKMAKAVGAEPATYRKSAPSKTPAKIPMSKPKGKG